MAGFGAILGGAMEGWSEGRLSSIKAEREARMKELEEQRQDRRLAEDREFRSKEAAIGREFEAGEGEKTRAAMREGREDTQAFQSGESAADRKARLEEHEDTQKFTGEENEKTRAARREELSTSADIVKGEDGTDYVRTPRGLEPVKTADGKPVKLAGATKDKPAEVSTAEWLIQTGVAPDAASAWRLVRSARNDPEKSKASIYKAWLDALTKGQLGKADPAELEAQAREATEKTLEYLDMEETEPAPSGGGQKRSDVRTQDTEEVGTPANVIPSDPAKRVVNKIYINKSGQKARWTGKGWQPVG